MNTREVCGKESRTKLCSHCGWHRTNPKTTKFLTRDQVKLIQDRSDITHAQRSSLSKRDRQQIRDKRRVEEAIQRYRGTPQKATKSTFIRKARSALSSAIRTAKRGLDGYSEVTRCSYKELREFLAGLSPGHEIDHIYPLSRAASLEDAMWLNRLDNLRIVSRTINRQKGAKLL